MKRPVIKALEEILDILKEPKTLQELLTIVGRHNKLEFFCWKEEKKWQSLSSNNFVVHVIDFAEFLQTKPPQGPGIGADDHVAFLIYNGPEWHVVRMACAKIGAISIPILTEASNRDMEIILEKSRPKLVIVRDQAQKERVDKVLAKLHMNTPMATLRFTPVEDRLKLERTLHGHNPVYEETQQENPKTNPLPNQVTGTRPKQSENDLAMIFFTSGTTSDPKGAMHTHKSLLANVNACKQVFPVGPDDVVLSFLPVSHIFQQAVDTLALCVGATIAYTTPDQIRTTLPEINPTVMASVPKQFETMKTLIPMRIKKELKRSGKVKQLLVAIAMRMGEKNFSPKLADRIHARLTHMFLGPVRQKIKKQFLPRMRFFVSGGAPLEPSIGAFIQGALEIPIYQGWGMTEVAGAGTCNTPDLNILGSCGRPLPGTEIELRRNHLPEDLAADLPEGVGEVFFKGPVVMQGYYNEPEATAETLQDGWLKTGDIGRIDKKGVLWITGRKKGVLVLESGLKVHEEALSARIRSACPLVEQIVLFGHKKPHVVAVIYPNTLLLKDRVQGSLRKEDGTWQDSVKKAIMEEIRKISVATHERIKDIALLPNPLSAQDGTLTPTQKPRHRVITEKYGHLIDQMYH